ncbi:MAG: diguanylate cyclase [Gammaproteobacteria bacterium]|nr:diguanylate cyclase [Gammaproteobacteria bacterium]MBU1625367.1 diguanylate cyclase [Gammaproteobacteria bacterium]MBU1981627.1 diguanylate cyclase [Gammaproteobacteria bacterium]
MSNLSVRAKVFLWLSLILIVSDALFVWINYRAEQARFQGHLEQRATHLRNLFEVEMGNTALSMQQTATFVASMPEVQLAFHQGRLAAEHEGGGAGGPRAKLARERLLKLINTPWQELREHYDTRQLHFQFGSNATSFLRVHATDRFGDDLDGVRHTIFHALRDQRPTKGFECGRIICGIRGVTPVFLNGQHAGDSRFIGVLEAGTSFRTLLELLEKPSQAKFAVLLSMSHLSDTYFPDRLERLKQENPALNGNIVEATLHPEVRELLANAQIARLVEQKGTLWLKLGERHLAFTAFPLRDYLAQQDPQRPPIGTVMAWMDVEKDIQQLQRDLSFNVTYAVIAFLLIETMLFFALRRATFSLEKMIAKQTATLRDMAAHDELTGLYNRHYLDEFLQKEYASATRHDRTIAIAILDLDHFKLINDTHGHLVGDRVLVDAAALIMNRLRTSDLAFRFGGEEFLLVFPETDSEEARRLCEELRLQLCGSGLGGLEAGKITASFGVAQMAVSGESLDTLLGRADSALYAAKDKGRNRVETAVQ